jgi:hypothetical protein
MVHHKSKIDHWSLFVTRSEVWEATPGCLDEHFANRCGQGDDTKSNFATVAPNLNRFKERAAMRCFLMMILFGVLAVSPALPQQKKNVPSLPKPADNGPSLETTMRFIQEKMNEQGQVGYIETNSNAPAVTFRHLYRISDVLVDPVTCTLRTTESTFTTIDVAGGNTYSEGGKAVTGDDLRRRSVETSTTSFKDVEKITVESREQRLNRNFAQQAHPEITTAVTPPVFLLVLSASKPLFSFHTNAARGNEPAPERDIAGKENAYTFREEETANRVAKAMIHAVELCGGGSKPEPF